MGAVILIPTVDPDEKLGKLISELRGRGFSRFIVVDDGSGDACEALFAELELDGVRVLHHAVNLGKGAAIKTGLAALRFLYPEATHVVTVDDDGQHLPEDVERVALAVGGRHEHAVIGVRNLDSKGVPLRSRLGNAFSSVYFKFDTGLFCPDTQTGLRAFPVSLVPLALSTPGTRYEYEMNFLTALVKRGVPLAMVPIRAVYVNDNAGSHFSAIRDSLRIYQQFFRFAGSSLVCALTDLLLFALIAAALDLETAALVGIATVVARVVSGVLNFNLNRRWSFSDAGSAKGDVSTQGVRYGALFLLQMCASALFVTVLSMLPLPLVAVKALVDGALFVVSFFIQRNWVFKRPAGSQARIVKGGSYGEKSSSGSISAV